MEFPSAVETLEILASFWQDLASRFGIGKGKEMSNQVIVQNEAYTVTGDSIIEDSIIDVWKPYSRAFQLR